MPRMGQLLIRMTDFTKVGLTRQESIITNLYMSSKSSTKYPSALILRYTFSVVSKHIVTWNRDKVTLTFYVDNQSLAIELFALGIREGYIGARFV